MNDKYTTPSASSLLSNNPFKFYDEFVVESESYNILPDLIQNFQKSFTLYFIYIFNAGLAFTLSQIARSYVQRTFTDNLAHTIQVRLGLKTLNMSRRRIYICVDFEPIHLIKSIKEIQAHFNYKRDNQWRNYSNICALSEFLEFSPITAQLRLPKRAIDAIFNIDNINSLQPNKCLSSYWCGDIIELINNRPKIEILYTFAHITEAQVLKEWSMSYIFQQSTLIKNIPPQSIHDQLLSVVAQYWRTNLDLDTQFYNFGFGFNNIRSCFSIHILLDFIIYEHFTSNIVNNSSESACLHLFNIHNIVNLRAGYENFHNYWGQIVYRLIHEPIHIIDTWYRMAHTYESIQQSAELNFVPSSTTSEAAIQSAKQNRGIGPLLGEPIWYTFCMFDWLLFSKSNYGRCGGPYHQPIIYWPIPCNTSIGLVCEIIHQHQDAVNKNQKIKITWDSDNKNIYKINTEIHLYQWSNYYMRFKIYIIDKFVCTKD